MKEFLEKVEILKVFVTLDPVSGLELQTSGCLMFI